MGILSQMEQRRGVLDDYWYQPLAPPVDAGVEVTEETVMHTSAVWAAVSILSGTMGSLPLKLYRRRDRSREEVTNHPAIRVLGRQPNDWQTPFEWREMLQGHVLIRGNAYCQKVFDRMGRVAALVPLNPSRMEVETDDGALVYKFRRVDGGVRRFAPEEIHHYRGLSNNGVSGYSVVTMARQSLGVAIAAERHGARYFGNSARPSGLLKTEGKLDKDERERISTSWRASQGGTNQHSVAVLEGGLEWQTIGFSAQDSQFLETRNFQVVEVARWFNMPPHLLKELSRATFSNIEQQSLEFVIHTIRPWVTRWESRLNRDFLTEREQDEGLYFKFNLEALLRGDSASRSAFYQQMFQLGAYSPNDIRALEDENPVDGGDQRFVPLNMVPLEQASEALVSEDTPPEPDDRASNAPQVEQRDARAVEQRSLAVRQRIHRAYRGILEDAGDRIVRREVQAVGRAVTAELGERSLASFSERIERFYDEHRGYARRQILPILMSFAEMIGEAASEELGVPWEMTDEVRRFVEDYADAFANRHVGSSLGQLEALVRDVAAADLTDALTTRLDEWSETRARKIGFRESVQAGGAVAVTIYAANRRRAVWRNTGESCPLCLQLEGRTVRAGQPFVTAGTVIDPEDGETEPLTVERNIGHPQLHQGCDCMVAAA